MALPQILKSFNLFNEGGSYAGDVLTVELPKLATKDEEYRAGGMLGAISVPMGLDVIKLGWTAGGYLADAIKQWGITKHDGVMLRFAGAVQSPDAEDYKAVEIVVRGRHSELDMGSAEAAKKTEHKYTTVCSYYKLTLDGTVLIEIDLVAGVHKVGGVDRTASLRAALGI